MPLGFQSMESQATCWAQVEQIQADKVAASTIATKKANNFFVTGSKRLPLHLIYLSPVQKCQKKLGMILSSFCFPYLTKTQPHPLFNSIKKAVEKSGAFESLYGSKWDVLMEMKLWYFQSKPSSWATSENNDLAVLGAQLHLGSNYDDDCDIVVHLLPRYKFLEPNNSFNISVNFICRAKPNWPQTNYIIMKNVA